MQTIVSLKSDTLKFTRLSISNPDCPVDIPEGITVVTGLNGSGKTSLAEIIMRGGNFATNRIDTSPGLRIKYFSFNDIHSLSGFKAQYYQQRYEATMNDEVPTVAELLGHKLESPHYIDLAAKFGLSDAASKRINFLSSGELRKLLLVNALLSKPDLLILDNPFIGLDASSRISVEDIIRQLPSLGVSVMLLLCDPCHIPSYADFVILMERMTIASASSLKNYIAPHLPSPAPINELPMPVTPRLPVNTPIVDFKHITLSHSGRILLSDFSWHIKQGEKWFLSGPNGSGKTTLLSLIHADNPQAYALDVSIFGRRRGSGETIWDIKRHIGYISSEMHLYFTGGNIDVLNIVAQGLNDTIGMFRKPTESQLSIARKWLEILGLGDYAFRRFDTLSTGLQRLTLIARTLVKNPDLLILDEPLHGLDPVNASRVIETVENLSSEPYGVTLIFVTHCDDEIPRGIDRVMRL